MLETKRLLLAVLPLHEFTWINNETSCPSAAIKGRAKLLRTVFYKTKMTSAQSGVVLSQGAKSVKLLANPINEAMIIENMQMRYSFRPAAH